MLTTERRIMRSLMNATRYLPDNATEQDALFVLDSTNAVLAALMGAEEPMNKSHRFYDQATRTIEELRAFVLHRHKERWNSVSTYPYDEHRLNDQAKRA